MKRALPFLLLFACGGSAATIDPSVGDGAPTGVVPDGGDASAPKDDAALPLGPTVRIRLAVSTEPFRHSDGLSGQTPVAQKIGISGLLLYTSETDTAPLAVYDMGTAFVLADLGAGRNTLLAEVPMKSLRAGRYQFKVGGNPYGPPAEGLDAPMPQLPDAGGFVLKKEAGRAYYGYPCDILVDPAAAGDWTVTMTLNMDKNFRWADETAPGYAAGVWDTTPVTFERVMRFGANAFDLGSTRP